MRECAKRSLHLCAARDSNLGCVGRHQWGWSCHDRPPGAHPPVCLSHRYVGLQHSLCVSLTQKNNPKTSKIKNVTKQVHMSPFAKPRGQKQDTPIPDPSAPLPAPAFFFFLPPGPLFLLFSFYAAPLFAFKGCCFVRCGAALRRNLHWLH